MKLFRNTALAIVVVIVLNILISSLTEWNAITTEIHALGSTARIASEHAIGEFEITQFSGFDDNLGNTFDISDGHNSAEYRKYLQELEAEAKRKMRGTYNNSDMQHIIMFLQEELSDFKTGRNKSVLSPFAFSFTFLEEKKLTSDFSETVRTLVRHNYEPTVKEMENSPKSINPLAFNGTGTVEITKATAKITEGPKLLDLTGGIYDGTDKYAAFAKLFGTKNKNAMDMVNGVHLLHNMFNYVVYYDVEFTIEWKHHTRTLFFKAAGFGESISGNFVDDQGQIAIPMKPIVLHRRYIVTN